MLSKKKLLECGGFNEDISLIAVEDYDLWLRISRSGAKIILLNSYLLGYRVTKSSLSYQKLKRVRKFFSVYQNYYLTQGSKLYVKTRSGINVGLFIFFWLFRKLIKR